jgi:hypothetical protein
MLGLQFKGVTESFLSFRVVTFCLEIKAPFDPVFCSHTVVTRFQDQAGFPSLMMTEKYPVVKGGSDSVVLLPCLFNVSQHFGLGSFASVGSS